MCDDFEVESVYAGQQDQRDLDPEMNAVVRGDGLCPKQQTSRDEHQSESKTGNRDNLSPDLRDGLICEGNPDQTKVEPAQNSDRQGNAHQMKAFDDRKGIHRFQNSSANGCFRNPLTEVTDRRERTSRL